MDRELKQCPSVDESARRLTACLKAFEGVRTHMIEQLALAGGIESAAASVSKLPE